MISRLPAIAPRVANPIAVPIATIMSAKRAAARMTTALAMAPSRVAQTRWSSRSACGTAEASALTQRVEVLGALAAQPDEDQPGDGQLTEVEPGAEPRLKKLFRFGLGKSLRRIHLVRLRRDGDSFGDEAFDIVARPRLHLDRRVAQHIRAPGLRGVGDQQRRARGQAREKGHDRNDDDQRASSDRIARDERRVGLERGSGSTAKIGSTIGSFMTAIRQKSSVCRPRRPAGGRSRIGP